MAHYYQPEIETMPYEQLRELQNARFMKQIRHVWDNVPYYRKKMEERVTSQSIILLFSYFFGHKSPAFR